MGQTMGKILGLAGSVQFWDKLPGVVSNQRELADILPGADVVFFCVPAAAMREAVGAASSLLPPLAVVVSVAKGVDPETGETMDELLAATLPAGQSFALLGGPMLARELLDGLVGVGVVGTEKAEVFSRITELFHETNLHLEHSTDVRGVALVGVLKNIYALSLGIADGLDLSGNVKGWLTAKAADEMSAIVPALGGNREAVFSAAGLGDLVATGFSPYSRNRQTGEELARTGATEVRGEGFVSFPKIAGKLGKSVSDFPLLSALSEVVMEKRPAREVFAKYIGVARLREGE